MMSVTCGRLGSWSLRRTLSTVWREQFLPFFARYRFTQLCRCFIDPIWRNIDTDGRVSILWWRCWRFQLLVFLFCCVFLFFKRIYIVFDLLQLLPAQRMESVERTLWSWREEASESLCWLVEIPKNWPMCELSWVCLVCIVIDNFFLKYFRKIIDLRKRFCILIRFPVYWILQLLNQI